jgi:DNA excision repair protein ERCC-2
VKIKNLSLMNIKKRTFLKGEHFTFLMSSNNLKNSFFPHKIIREGQDLLVKDMGKTFSTEKILIAHAPTGLGKTASALSVALEFAIEKNKKIFFLTNRHTQHKIAVETLKLINNNNGKNIICADMIGKKWMCNQEVAGLFGNEFNEYCKSVVEKGECEYYNNFLQKKKVTVEGKKLLSDLKQKGALHNEEMISICKNEKKCSYEVSLALAKEAKVIISDYYYMFNPMVQMTIFKKLDLEMEDVILIVDEGHNLPNRVTEMLSNNLTNNMLKNSIMEAKKYRYNGLIFWLQEINKIISGLAKFDDSYNKEKLVTKEEFMKKVSVITDYDELINEFESAADEVRKKQRKSYLGGIATFLEEWKGEDEGFVRIISEKRGKYGEVIILSHSCLDPSIITKTVFDRIHAGVIMSGTLKPTFMYKDILDIKRGVEKEYQSPFPPENRLSLIIPETSTKYTLRGEVMYEKMGKICSEICSLINGNIALFFPSYMLRDSVAKYIESDKKLFWEKNDMNKNEKETFLNSFKSEKEKGGVLLGVNGANFAEGIDLPGDLLKGVVVIGLPLAKPDLKTRKVIQYYESKYGKGWDYGYTYPAMSKCIQSAGRCIRSETDKGVVIYLDERFAWQNYYSCLPREGLIVSKDFKKFLKEFF